MLLLQSVPNHISAAPSSSKTALAQEVNQLEGQLEFERRLVETLETKQRTLLSQLEAVTQRETELQEEVTLLEKNLTILKHDLKEVRLFFLHVRSHDKTY
jgi:chromosome segregation ATPase